MDVHPWWAMIVWKLRRGMEGGQYETKHIWILDNWIFHAISHNILGIFLLDVHWWWAMIVWKLRRGMVGGQYPDPAAPGQA